MYLWQDMKRMPYKHSYLNILQALSSACLIVITVCNAPAYYSASFSVMQISHMDIVVKVLQYVEMLMQATVPLSLVVWTLWNKYKSSRSKDESRDDE